MTTDAPKADAFCFILLLHRDSRCYWKSIKVWCRILQRPWVRAWSLAQICPLTHTRTHTKHTKLCKSDNMRLSLATVPSVTLSRATVWCDEKARPAPAPVLHENAFKVTAITLDGFCRDFVHTSNSHAPPTVLITDTSMRWQRCSVLLTSLEDVWFSLFFLNAPRTMDEIKRRFHLFLLGSWIKKNKRNGTLNGPRLVSQRHLTSCMESLCWMFFFLHNLAL